jgi:hypothetical protein
MASYRKWTKSDFLCALKLTRLLVRKQESQFGEEKYETRAVRNKLGIRASLKSTISESEELSALVSCNTRIFSQY